ncbi:hypothetical protein [Blastopirellula marina]|nr:hypothetical protein [Blastopirellula marina]
MMRIAQKRQHSESRDLDLPYMILAVGLPQEIVGVRRESADDPLLSAVPPEPTGPDARTYSEKRASRTMKLTA